MFMTPLSLQRTRGDREREHRARQVVFTALFLAGMAAWYLVAANAVVTASYRLSEAMASRAALTQELEASEAAALAAFSPEAVEIRAQEMGFLPIQQSQYLAVPGTTVAVR